MKNKRRGSKAAAFLLSGLILGKDVLLVEMLDYRTAGYDPDKHSAVIRDRNEICLHRSDDQVFYRSAYCDRRVLFCLIQKIRQAEILKALYRHGMRLAAFALDDEPQKVALAYRCNIVTVTVKDRNSRKARSMHLFQCLSDSEISIHKDYILLGARKESYIHTILRRSVSAQILVDAYLERSCGKTVLRMERSRAV